MQRGIKSHYRKVQISTILILSNLSVILRGELQVLQNIFPPIQKSKCQTRTICQILLQFPIAQWLKHLTMIQKVRGSNSTFETFMLILHSYYLLITLTSHPLYFFFVEHPSLKLAPQHAPHIIFFTYLSFTLFKTITHKSVTNLFSIYF